MGTPKGTTIVRSQPDGPVEVFENPDDYPQWLDRDKRPFGMVWLQAPPRKSIFRYLNPVSAPSVGVKAIDVSVQKMVDPSSPGHPRTLLIRNIQEAEKGCVTIPMTLPSLDIDHTEERSYWSPEYSAVSIRKLGNWLATAGIREKSEDISPEMWEGGKLVQRDERYKPLAMRMDINHAIGV